MSDRRVAFAGHMREVGRHAARPAHWLARIILVGFFALGSLMPGRNVSVATSDESDPVDDAPTEIARAASKPLARERADATLNRLSTWVTSKRRVAHAVTELVDASQEGATEAARDREAELQRDADGPPDAATADDRGTSP